MSYKSWYENHAKKHRAIVDKLLEKNYTKEQIVDYFEYENMKTNESEFCPLYEKNEKCHDIDTLNCYLCACPHFRFNDNGVEKIDSKTRYSFCSINSKKAKDGIYGDAIHQDCSKCLIPHAKKYILKNFDFEWKEIMKECEEK